jgi:hypothetical protein
MRIMMKTTAVFISKMAELGDIELKKLVEELNLSIIGQTENYFIFKEDE